MARAQGGKEKGRKGRERLKLTELSLSDLGSHGGDLLLGLSSDFLGGLDECACPREDGMGRRKGVVGGREGKKGGERGWKAERRGERGGEAQKRRGRREKSRGGGRATKAGEKGSEAKDKASALCMRMEVS